MRKVVRFGTVGVLAALVVLTLAACGGSGSKATATSASDPAAPRCPSSWRVSWQKLANEIDAPVYCPSWLPQPLAGRWNGSPFNGQSVDPDRSYLIRFLWFDSGEAGNISEVHVNLRGQAGNPKIPTCDNTLLVAGKTVHRPSPCFADPKPVKRHFGKIVATLYTANQGSDQWHLLYSWRYRGGLYTLSEHVAPPYSYTQVLANLDRMMRGLVLVEPKPKLKT